MENLIKIGIFIKELRLVILALGGINITLFTNLERALEYNLHLLVAFVCISYFMYFMQNRQIKDLRERIELINIDHEKEELKERVSRAYKEFKDYDCIDFDSSMNYIKDLEERRKRLGLNSYTEAALKELTGKFKLQ